MDTAALYPSHPLSGPAAEDYLARRLGFPLDTLLRFPKFFLIETIRACNARCIMCGIDFDSQPTAIMSDALFDKIAAEIGQWRDHVEKVMLYLDGEPLLDKKMPARVARMKAEGARCVNLATNASLLDEKRGRSLIEAGLDQVYITLDSLRPQVYEAIRLRLKFQEVYDNIRGFIALRDRLRPGLMIRLQMIEQELNKGEGAAFREHWRGHLAPADQVVVQKAHNWAGGARVPNVGDEAAVNRIPCIALWGTFVCHHDGLTPLCCMDTESRHPIGDLTTESIEGIWQGLALERLRDLHTGGRRAEIKLCDGCTLWREDKHQTEDGP